MAQTVTQIAIFKGTATNGTVMTAIAMKCGTVDAPIIVKLNAARTAAEVHVGADMKVDLTPGGVSTINSGAVVARVISNGSLSGSVVYVLSGGVDELVLEVSTGTGGQLYSSTSLAAIF